MDKNSCSCGRNNRRYGALSSLNSRGTNSTACSDNSPCRHAATSCPECTTCAGSPLFYTGRCGQCKRGGCNSCNERCGCSPCNECSDCAASWNEIPLSRASARNISYQDCACQKHEKCHACAESAHGVFVSSCPISVCDGEIIALDMESGDNSHFRETDGCVHVMKEGVYEIIYSLNLPSGVAASSCLALSLDGNRIYHSAAPVESCGAQHTSRFTGHSVMKIRRGQKLAIHADGGIEIQEKSGNFPALQLTIIKLG